MEIVLGNHILEDENFLKKKSKFHSRPKKTKYIKRDKKSKENTMKNATKNYTCFKCRKLGHIAKHCPIKRR